MIRIRIDSIAHYKQRYVTLGDWQNRPDGTIEIHVSAMPDWRYEALVAVHELIEVLLCNHRSVGETVVDKWDLDHLDSPDPGMERDAPYHREHRFALAIEQLLAHELDVSWQEYEQYLERRSNGTEDRK